MFIFDANGYTGKYGTVTGLVSGRTYWIGVYAHNALGFGAPTISSPVVPRPEQV